METADKFFRKRPRRLTDLGGLPYKDFKQQLNDLYKPCCDEHAHLPNLAADGDIEAMLQKLVKKIYDEQGMPEKIDAGVTKYYAAQLWKAITEGYGEDLASVDFDTPDYTMLRHLQEDVYQFSGAKNYQQLKELSQALVSDEGAIRTFAEFKEAALLINKEQVTTYLQAEYNLAINSGQMASKWETIEENKDVLPLLQFDAVIDDRTTAICSSLNEVIKPVADPFWDMYYPPNHFGCRSTVRSLSSGKITGHDDYVTPDKIPDMFKTNLAKNGLAFPPKHPYFVGLPEQVKEQSAKILNKK
jgi:SPP1 gp7 family putative phage head morphogenesis protein